MGLLVLFLHIMEVYMGGFHKVDNFMGPYGPLNVVFNGSEVWLSFDVIYESVVQFLLH